MHRKAVAAAAGMILGCAVQAGEVKIGMVTGITGPIAVDAVDFQKLTAGYVNMINAQGGVNGNKLVLVAKDDQYNPAKTAPLVQEAVEKEKVVALVNGAGTATTMAVIKSGILKKHKVPLVGVFSGAEAIRGPGFEEIFHTRPSYSEEVKKFARLASTLGLKRVALLYQDDAFGQEVLQSVSEVEQDHGIAVVAKVPYKPGEKEFEPHARTIEQARPQAIFLLALPSAVYPFMKAYGAPTGAAQIYALSFVSPQMLASVSGEAKARGVGISQVMPNPNSATIPLIKDFRTFLSSPYGQGITARPVTLEAYLNIRLLVDALRMAGPNASGEKVLLSLAAMQKHQVGGFPIEFSQSKRNGSAYIDIAVVGANARLLY